MSHGKNSHALYEQITRWRWIAPITILGLAALFQLLLWGVQRWTSPDYYPWLTIALYGLTGGIVAWFGLGWLGKRIAQQREKEQKKNTKRGKTQKKARKHGASQSMGDTKRNA